jgi:outer membrane protein OmpA-like peptidoglycan-associated protein/tetratricopeptide (TPR) repeat protein
MLKSTLYILLIVCTPFFVFGQYKYSTSNKKAIKAYEEAILLYNKYNFDSAIDQMKKAVKADDHFTEAYIVLAEIYIDKGDKKNAINAYKNVIAINPEFFPELYLPLAQLEMMESQFPSAKEHLEKYSSYNTIKPASRSIASKMLKSCNFAIKAMENPVPFNPVNLGDSINTEFDEYWPSITADEQTLLITRLVPKKSRIEGKVLAKNTNNYQEDFYISKKENGFWQMAINAGNALNTADNEGAQSIYVDGKLMYYTACSRSDGKGRCDIYVSRNTKEGWSEGVNIGSPVNSKYWEAQPSISPDGKTLYFVSNREGGLGQKDIWNSFLRADGTWSKPVNLGKNINTSGVEQSPFIHPDNKTLYFSSEGRIGMGGFDIYKVTKNSDGTWGEPVNLGYPINTVANEIGLIVNAKGDVAMFSSDRIPEKGKDIFEFELYKEARPQAVSYLKGIVFDKTSKYKLQANFELINLETNKIVMQAQSDALNGEFLVCIPSDNNYALNVSKAGYLFYSDNFTLKGTFEITEPFLKDIALNPIKVGEKQVLKNIFYETDSYELDKKSIVELTKLFDFLVNNPGLKIEISGHTDNVGAAVYNLNLSMNRSKSVYNYLIEHGILQSRLEYKGYGEKQPIQLNETEKGRAENRRTEIKIISNE